MSLKKFKDLTLKGQKMRIVRDAIVQIEMENWEPKTGVYMEFNSDVPEDQLDDKDDFGMVTWEEKIMDENLDLQKVLKSGIECEVCAKGALFASCVLSTDKVKGRDDFGDEGFQSK